LQNKDNNKLIASTSFYDYDQVDDLSNFAANIAQQNTNNPISFIRGTLNKHNVEVLQNGVIKSETLNSWVNYADTLKRLQKRLKKLMEIPFYRKKTITIQEIKRNMNTPDKVYPNRKFEIIPVKINK